MELETICRDTCGFLEQMRIPRTWEFRFSPTSEPNLIGSALAAMLGTLNGWTASLTPQEKQQWAQRIAQCQRPDGWFDDADIQPCNLCAGYGRDRALLHRTRHALMALRALGGRPRYPLYAADSWLGHGCMRHWCERLNLADYWYSSNMMMDAALMLLENAVLRHNRKAGVAAVHELLDFCDDAIDPRTGYHDKGLSEVRNAMAGAMHLYPLYLVCKRPISALSAALETTLSLQQPDGLFAYSSGSGGEDCLDYDAAIILANLGFLQNEFRGHILTAFERLRNGLGICRNPDGGFCPHRREEHYCFGTKTTSVAPGQSSLWATYSRLLTYTAIEGFRQQQEPLCVRTAHNFMEIWDGGSGLMSILPFSDLGLAL